MNITRQYVQSILFADDDDEDYLIFKMAVTEISENILVTRAQNGEILIEILNHHLPDILFLDLFMPYKDGKQCIVEIRQNREFDNLPIVIYTGMDNLDSVGFYRDAGANLYLVKPLYFNDLLQKLRFIIGTDWREHSPDNFLLK